MKKQNNATKGKLPKILVSQPAKVTIHKIPTGVRGLDDILGGGIPDFSEEGQGVKLSGVTGGSPAEKAGLMAGDTIVKFGGKDLRNLYDYTYALQGRKPGEKVNIVVKRIEDGKTVERTFEVTLGSRPDASK